MAAATFSTLQLEEVAGIISRATRHAAIDTAELGREIEDLLSAVGTANDGREDAILFAHPPIPDASHLDLVEQLQTIAASDDPLDRSICYGLALAELNAAARNKWTSRRYNRRINRRHMLLDVTFDFLTERERADVKEFALQLAAYHRLQIKRQRPAKIDQDTLLDGLADIYLKHTGSSKHPYELPHSVRSNFVLFCHAILRPFFPLTEVSPKALSNRWNNLKRRHFTPLMDLRFSRKQDEA
jgi:hypothetical protein